MEKQNYLHKKRCHFAELLTPWLKRKRLRELSATADPLEIWFPSASTLFDLITQLHRALKDGKDREKNPPSSWHPALFPTAPIFLCILPKGSQAYSHTFIYIRDSQPHVPPPNHLGSFCQYICLHPMENYSVSIL